MPARLLPSRQLRDEEVLEYLWSILPKLYKVASKTPLQTNEDVEELRTFLKTVDAEMSEMRHLINFMIEWLDPWQCPYPVLPFLAPMVGVEFNYDIPEEFARREIASAIYIWKRKGSIVNLKTVVRLFIGQECTVREYFLDVMRSNVYGQAYPENTLPQLTEYHATNTWDGTKQIPSEFGRSYGSHGGDMLYKNHIGIYIDIPDEWTLQLWYGQKYSQLLLEKLQKILDKVILYGAETHLIWTLVYEDYYPIVYTPEFIDEGIDISLDSGLGDITTWLDYRGILFSNNTVAWPWSLEVMPPHSFLSNDPDYVTPSTSIMGAVDTYEDVLTITGVDYIQDGEPAAPAEDELWYDTDDYILYWYHDGAWVVVDYYTGVEPSGASEGEVWYELS